MKRLEQFFCQKNTSKENGRSLFKREEIGMFCVIGCGDGGLMFNWLDWLNLLNSLILHPKSIFPLYKAAIYARKYRVTHKGWFSDDCIRGSFQANTGFFCAESLGKPSTYSIERRNQKSNFKLSYFECFESSLLFHSLWVILCVLNFPPKKFLLDLYRGNYRMCRLKVS